ncbi:hypothetical protein Bbelb_317260 [Branchiostoma belcheri]|nr:hypothetical protein Bbelb_317260 [Branchiostoma belcheri]
MSERGTRTFRSNIAMFADGGNNLKSEELIHYVHGGQAVQHKQQVPADLTDLFEDYIQIDDFERTYNRRQRQEEREDDPDHIVAGHTKKRQAGTTHKCMILHLGPCTPVSQITVKPLRTHPRPRAGSQDLVSGTSGGSGTVPEVWVSKRLDSCKNGPNPNNP